MATLEIERQRENYGFTQSYAVVSESESTSIGLYNYFGFAFNDVASSECAAKVRFIGIDLNGRLSFDFSLKLGAFEGVTVDLRDFGVTAFEGRILVKMRPDGNMRRLKGSRRLIDTSFFTAARDSTDAVMSLNHELFQVNEGISVKESFWSTSVLMAGLERLRVLLLDKRWWRELGDLAELGSIPEAQGTVTAWIDGKKIISRHVRLQHQGGAWVDLPLDELRAKVGACGVVGIEVSGVGIEQPLSEGLYGGRICRHHF